MGRVAAGGAAAALLVTSGIVWAGSCGRTAPRITTSLGLRGVAQHLRAGEPVRILAIGSSSTEGVGASDKAHSYPAQLAQRLRAAWPSADIEIRNAGIGGETADETLARLEGLLSESRKPDLVLWQVGTNDAVRGTGEEAFERRLRHGIALVKQAGSELVILDQQFFPGIKDVAQYERYVRTIETNAASAHVAVFSRYALMRGWASEDPALLAGMLSRDGFHMSDKGYSCLADSLSGEMVATVDRTVSRREVAQAKHGSRTVTAEAR